MGGSTGREVSQEGEAVIREIGGKIPGNHRRLCRCLLKSYFHGCEETIKMDLGKNQEWD